MPREWSNWSGSVRFAPCHTATPADEAELCALVRQAAAQGQTVRVVGAGHSSAPLVETSDLLISLERLQGMVDHSTARNEATIRAGTRLHDVGTALHAVGLALENLGDVDVQTIGGAIGTGIHGSGQQLKILSSMLIGFRMVTATGDILECTAQDNPDVLRAARVALGTLGIFTTVTLRVVSAFQLQRREWCAQVDDGLALLDRLIAENRNFDMYWYPRSDHVKLRILNPPGAGTQQIPRAVCVSEQLGWSHEVLPTTRELRFEEMEYALPAEAGLACFRAVRQRIKERWRASVGWRVLYRTSAADDALLSTNFERDTVTISIHQNNTLPFWDYFRDIEPIFRANGGRPHWGKKHTLQAAELRLLYPCWEQFHAIRTRLDPTGVFLNGYLRALLDDHAADETAARQTGGIG